MRRALVGAQFPASRSHLIETATSNGSSQHVIDTLRALPGRVRFTDRAAVFVALEAAE
jgi:hypothetical protein